MSAVPSDDSLAAAVSAAVSRLFLDQFGRGPVHVETFVNGDVLLTLMRDVFTTAERALIADGRHDNVLTTRMLWQAATTDAFKASVAEATGREVVSVVSGFELEEELATEVFVLAPA
jgi:uncharacterized protein YbcI